MMSVEPHLPPRTRKDDRIQWKVLGSANTTRYWRAAPRSDGHNLSSFRSKTPNRTKMLTNIVMVFFFWGGRSALSDKNWISAKGRQKHQSWLDEILEVVRFIYFFVPLGHLSFICWTWSSKKYVCLFPVSREAHKPPSGKLKNPHL